MIRKTAVKIIYRLLMKMRQIALDINYEEFKSIFSDKTNTEHYWQKFQHTFQGDLAWFLTYLPEEQRWELAEYIRKQIQQVDKSTGDSK